MPFEDAFFFFILSAGETDTPGYLLCLFLVNGSQLLFVLRGFGAVSKIWPFNY
jgi:hypothetical protein